MAARPPRRRPAPSQRRARGAQRRNQRSDLGARILTAVPLVVARDRARRGGRLGLRRGAVRARRDGAARAVHDVRTRAPGDPRWASWRVAGVMVAAQAGGASTVLLAFVAAIPVIFLLGLAQPRRAGRRGHHGRDLRRRLDRPRVRARGPAARPAARRRGRSSWCWSRRSWGTPGAYLGGRAFGRRKLAPSISPNKSVEGLIIGIVVGTIGAWFAGPLRRLADRAPTR